ncbi:hypothetical protein NN561_017834 [Cricetulus griseus]
MPVFKRPAGRLCACAAPPTRGVAPAVPSLRSVYFRLQEPPRYKPGGASSVPVCGTRNRQHDRQPVPRGRGLRRPRSTERQEGHTYRRFLRCVEKFVYRAFPCSFLLASQFGEAEPHRGGHVLSRCFRAALGVRDRGVPRATSRTRPPMRRAGGALAAGAPGSERGRF